MTAQHDAPGPTRTEGADITRHRHDANEPQFTAPVVSWTEARGIAPDEVVSVAQVNGGAFLATTMTAAHAGRGISGTLAGSDVWVSANPMRSGLPAGRKGTAADVTRFACAFADLDVKPGGMPSWEAPSPPTCPGCSVLPPRQS